MRRAATLCPICCECATQIKAYRFLLQQQLLTTVCEGLWGVQRTAELGAQTPVVSPPREPWARRDRAEVQQCKLRCKTQRAAGHQQGLTVGGSGRAHAGSHRRTRRQPAASPHRPKASSGTCLSLRWVRISIGQPQAVLLPACCSLRAPTLTAAEPLPPPTATSHRPRHLLFQKWAPKSSQAWRLGNSPADLRRLRGVGRLRAGCSSLAPPHSYPRPREPQHPPTLLHTPLPPFNGSPGEESEDEITEGDVEVLNARLAEARQQGGAAAVGAAAAAAAQEARAAEEEEDAFDSSNDQPSFLRSTDEEVAAALADRIQEVASSKPGPASSADGGGDGGVEGEALTGPLLRELIFAKWGKTYDVRAGGWGALLGACW